jgi:nucleotide-binding universal stress UspA family protein
MVACDLSEYAVNSLRYAFELVENLKASLVIVNVINQRDLIAVKEAVNRIGVVKQSFSFSMDKYLENLREERSRLIQKLIEEISIEDVRIKKVIKYGVPFQKLIEAIKEENADILVMGEKGRGNIAGVLFGSTAEKMFHHCPIPLLSIREKKAHRRRQHLMG